ncbi:MAG: hypothetical protein H6737_07450 [Alphaproteobacteria bacterium]|nr:hypothetical protein [Alphaproteobacteria bacterium]
MIGVALVATAWAGFGVRSSREPLPSREVERSVVLPKGWTELDLSADLASATKSWDADGAPALLEVPWRTQTVAAGVRYGVAPGVELFGTLPWRRASGYVVQTGFATAEVGGRLALERSEAPFHSVGLEVAGRVPIGFDGGSLETPGKVPFATGTGDLRLAVDARRGMDGLLFRGRVEAMRRFAGRVGWRDGRVKPGDQAAAEAEVLVQAGPIAFGPSARGVVRGPVRTAAPGESLFPVRGSAGTNVDVAGRLLVHLTRGAELEGRLGWAVLGQDDTFVRLDELHPARSHTAGASVRARW